MLGTYFKNKADALGTSLGEKKIEVKYVPSVYRTLFIRCYTVSGEPLYFPSEKVRNAEELGLSLRRVR